MTTSDFIGLLVCLAIVTIAVIQFILCRPKPSTKTVWLNSLEEVAVYFKDAGNIEASYAFFGISYNPALQADIGFYQRMAERHGKLIGINRMTRAQYKAFWAYKRRADKCYEWGVPESLLNAMVGIPETFEQLELLWDGWDSLASKKPGTVYAQQKIKNLPERSVRQPMTNFNCRCAVTPIEVKQTGVKNE